MTGFEPGSSGIGINGAVNCATPTVLRYNCLSYKLSLDLDDFTRQITLQNQSFIVGCNNQPNQSQCHK